MKITANKAIDILKSKGVENLYHANSIITSCQFLQRQNLLSRGTVEQLNLPQTQQYTDKIDKKYGIWFDIFVDSVDIHKKANRANSYGPVLFEMDVEILRDVYPTQIWVAKMNPTKWAGQKKSQRWFNSEQDLIDNFSYGSFDQMIVLRHCGGHLSLNKHLKKIVLDDPRQKSEKLNIDYFSMAFGALRLSMEIGRSKVKIEKRKCKKDCECVQHYKKNEDTTKRMKILQKECFFPHCKCSYHKLKR